jgi:hypothetical protein
MRAQLRFCIDKLINRGYIVLGHHCDAQKRTALSPWWGRHSELAISAIDRYMQSHHLLIRTTGSVYKLGSSCIEVSLRSNVADGRFLDAWSSLLICWAGMDDMSTHHHHHHHLLANKNCNNVVDAQIRSYGGSYKPKTLVLMVPDRKDVSLVHDDGFYPHRDVTTV